MMSPISNDEAISFLHNNNMKKEHRYFLAACLVKILRLESEIEFDFGASCHAYTPCLIAKSDQNTTSTPRIVQLPISFSEDNWIQMCSVSLSSDIEATSVKLIVDLNQEYVVFKA